MRLIYLALGWAAGIILAANTLARPVGLWLALVIVAVVLLWWNRRDSSFLPLSLFIVGLTLGGLRFAFVPISSDIAQYNNIGGLTIEGVIVAEPDVRDTEIDLQVEADTVIRAGGTTPTSGRVLVQAPPTTLVHYGDRIAATGILTVPAESDTFSYADYLARTGVFSVMQNTAVEVLSGDHGSPLYSALLDLKDLARRSIVHILPEPNAALLTGILLGDARGLPPEVSDAFSRVGASHIIAISGFNMAVLSGVIMGLLKRFRVRGGWAALIGLSVIGVYTIFVGASPSVVRAAIMSAMLVIGALIRRKTYVPASIAFVAVLLSALNPSVLWDVGFELSLFATLGLSLFATPFSQHFTVLLAHAFPRRTAVAVSDFLAEPITISLAAQVTTLPLLILYFGRLSIIAIIVNLLIIPVQAALLILGLAATLVAFLVPIVAQMLYWLDLILLSWTLAVVRLFARLPFADVGFQISPRLILLFYLMFLGGALMAATQPTWALHIGRRIRQRAVVTALVFAGVGVSLLMIALALSRPDGNLHIWMLDMGESNAVLVQTPAGAQMLVDGGRFPSRLLTALGDRLPFNDQEIEVLVITQPDEFDYGALASVLDRYSVGVTLSNGQPNLSPAYAALQEKLSAYPLVNVGAGYLLDTSDGVHLDVLHPQTQPDINDSLDDQTLTLRLTYRNISFLLTSDLSAEGQAALLVSGQWPLATVMQLPKHGGAHTLNTDFLKIVQPQAVVVQNDPANRLGDPDPDTLAKLGAIPIFRTDHSGTIHFWTDGNSLWSSGTR
jgi:competence protein ComEC